MITARQPGSVVLHAPAANQMTPTLSLPLRVVAASAAVVAVLLAGCAAQSANEDFSEPILCETKGVQAEIVLVVDRSFSIPIKDFQVVKQFLKALVSQLEISQAVTRVAVVSYADTITVDFDLRMYDDNASVARHVDALDNRRNGALTRTMDALRMARQNVLPQRRPGLPTFVILLTDGESRDGSGSGGAATQKTIREAAALRALDKVTVIVVGVGPSINVAELIGVATDGEKNVFTVSTFDKLDKALVEQLLRKTCVATPNICAYYRRYGDVIFVPASQHVNPFNGQLTLRVAEAFSNSSIVKAGDHVRVAVAPKQCQLAVGYPLTTPRQNVPSVTLDRLRNSFLHTAHYLRELSGMYVPRGGGESAAAPTRAAVLIVDHRLSETQFEEALIEAEQLKRAGVLIYVVAVGDSIEWEQAVALASANHAVRAGDYTDLFTLSELGRLELDGDKFAALFKLLFDELCRPKKARTN